MYDQVSTTVRDEKARLQRAVPWGILIGQHGGDETQALASIERGDVEEIEDNGRTFFAWRELSSAPLLSRISKDQNLEKSQKNHKIIQK